MRFCWLILFLHGIAWAEGPDLRGFLQGNVAPRLGASEGPDALLADARLQLEVAGSLRPGWAYFAKTDFFHDGVSGRPDVEVREAYVDYFGERFHLRLGRQIITWGVGDLLFINDVFPKDWDAFFSGRPLEYLKRGSDAVRVEVYGHRINLDIVLLPFHQEDRLPRSDRFSFPDPFGPVVHIAAEPATTWRNVEVALRLYGHLWGFDGSLYLYRGFYRTPARRPDTWPTPTTITVFFPRLNVYGFSLQGTVGEGVLSVEAGYYDSRQDASGRDVAVPNPQTRLLVGYTRQFATELTGGLQYYAEYTHHYGAYRATLPTGLPAAPRLRQLLTVRLSQWRRYHTERLSFLAFWSPSEGDYLLIPEYRLHVDDQTWVAVGLNLFGGPSNTLFGALDANDNLYLTLRRSF